MTAGYELAFMIGGLFLSLCAFSLVFGDNYLFRLGAAILSGAVSAYVCVLLAETYFYPLILELVSGETQPSPAQMLRAVAAGLGILMLFCKAYTNGKSGGHAVQTVLIAIAAAVMILGAAAGTVPAFIRSLAGQFRLAAIPEAERADLWYWLKTGTVTISALAALLYTRHYRFSGKTLEKGASGSFFGNVLVGFTFGAITAAVFLAAANILTDHVSGLIETVRTLMIK